MFVIPYATHARTSPPAGFGRAMDRRFEDSLDRRPARAAEPAPVRSPAMDFEETDAACAVAFDLPGVAKDQLKVSVDGRRLTLETVDRPGPEAGADERADATAPRSLYRERNPARYARTVVLPAEVDATQTQARFEHGVLTLTLRKRVAGGATPISID